MTKTQCNPVFLGRNTSTLVSTKIPVRKYYILIKIDKYTYVSRTKKSIRLRPPEWSGVWLWWLVTVWGQSLSSFGVGSPDRSSGTCFTRPNTPHIQDERKIPNGQVFILKIFVRQTRVRDQIWWPRTQNFGTLISVTSSSEPIGSWVQIWNRRINQSCSVVPCT